MVEVPWSSVDEVTAWYKILECLAQSLVLNKCSFNDFAPHLVKELIASRTLMISIPCYSCFCTCTWILYPIKLKTETKTGEKI